MNVKGKEKNVLEWLSGINESSIDGKSRVVIPQDFREFLGAEVYLTLSRDGCLRVYSDSDYRKLYENIMALKAEKAADINTNGLVYYYIKSVWHLKFDASGRICIPPQARRFLGMSVEDKNLLVVGSVDRAEIWMPDEYFGQDEKYHNEEFDTAARLCGAD